MYSSFTSEEERKEQLRKIFILCGNLLFLRRRARQKRWRHLLLRYAMTVMNGAPAGIRTRVTSFLLRTSRGSNA